VLDNTRLFEAERRQARRQEALFCLSAQLAARTVKRMSARMWRSAC
jgi:hypothetical protein